MLSANAWGWARLDFGLQARKTKSVLTRARFAHMSDARGLEPNRQPWPERDYSVVIFAAMKSRRACPQCQAQAIRTRIRAAKIRGDGTGVTRCCRSPPDHGATASYLDYTAPAGQSQHIDGGNPCESLTTVSLFSTRAPSAPWSAAFAACPHNYQVLRRQGTERSIGPSLIWNQLPFLDRTTPSHDPARWGRFVSHRPLQHVTP
jgi:hypothetical protein